MKTWRVFRTAGAAPALCFLFFFSPAHSQDHSQNRPPRAVTRATTQRSAEEQALFDAANRERTSQGLQPLHWDPTLALAAREHARLMAIENLLSHQCPGEPPLQERAAQAGAKFSVIAENVAIGPTAASIHDGWMHSSGHRKNILNAEVTAVGIATTRGREGIFAVQDFSRPVADLSLQQQEERVVLLLKETGLPAASVTEDARKTCRMNRGYAGPTALYLIRFEVTDLDKLPGELLQRLMSRKYGKAAVGACRGGDDAGFTRYRIAVVLN
ncbi:MAG: CAP domain-containing protein [Candidatus Acidiferrales bacterium]